MALFIILLIAQIFQVSTLEKQTSPLLVSARNPYDLSVSPKTADSGKDLQPVIRDEKNNDLNDRTRISRSMPMDDLSALHSSFGRFPSCMQIMPGDNNAPEKPGAGGNVDEIIRLHQEMGFNADRCNIAWGSVEYPKGKFHWEVIDQRLNKIFAAGIQPSIIVYGGNNYDGTIYWDRQIPGFDGLRGTREEYKRFVTRVVERYDGDGIDDGPINGVIKYWEAWNEPIYFGKISLEQAVDLYNDYYLAVKSADPEAKVISPGFAGGGNEDKGYIYEYFMKHAIDFDMISIHGFYERIGDTNLDDSYSDKVQRVDRDLKKWGLGDRPWWISEYGVVGTDWYKDPNLYAMRIVRSYVAFLYQMFHTNLVAASNWYHEGRNIAVIKWDQWTLKPPGRATRIFFSIFQNADIVEASQQRDPRNFRVYKFTLADGRNLFAVWALEGIKATVTLPIRSDKVIQTNFYGDSIQTHDINNGQFSVYVEQEPVYIQEVMESDVLPPAPPQGLGVREVK